jgi:hypothetical protein
MNTHPGLSWSASDKLAQRAASSVGSLRCVGESGLLVIANDRNVLRCSDSDSNPPSLHSQDSQANVVADTDFLILFTGENQHVVLLDLSESFLWINRSGT